jgi:hypothetical protein
MVLKHQLVFFLLILISNTSSGSIMKTERSTLTSGVTTQAKAQGNNAKPNIVPADVKFITNEDGVILYSLLGLPNAMVDAQWSDFTAFFNDYPKKKAKFFKADGITLKDTKKGVKNFNRFKLNAFALKSMNSAGGLSKFKRNHLSDKEPEDIVLENMGYLPPDLSSLPASTKGRMFIQKRSLKKRGKNASGVTGFGAAIDWRSTGKVGPIDDQQSCGDCWAFAGTSMIESFYAINNQIAVKTFSRQQALDCMQSAIGKPGSCNGGHFIYQTMYSVTASYVPDANYLYTGAQGTCTVPSTGAIDRPVTSYKVYDTVSPSQLYSILKRHPVAVNIDANSQEFMYYGTGILKVTCGTTPTHAVLLVGYGTDGTNNFWIIRNSWSDQWGEAGYARILIPSDSWDGCFMYTNVVELF